MSSNIETCSCLHCRFDLRGHFGVIVRCPECGNETPLALPLDAQECVAKECLRLESSSTISAVGIGLMVVVLILTQCRLGWVSGSFLLLAILLAIAGGLLLGKRCQFRIGWMQCLVSVYSVLIGLLLIVFLGCFIFVWLYNNLTTSPWAYFMSVLVLGYFIRIADRFFPRINPYRIVKDKHHLHAWANMANDIVSRVRMIIV